MKFFSELKRILLAEDVAKEEYHGSNSRNNDNGALLRLQEMDIPVQIARMKQKVITIEQCYPKEAEDLLRSFDGFKKFILDLDLNDAQSAAQVEEEFNKIKNDFTAFYKKSTEKFAITEAEKLTQRVEDLLFGKNDCYDVTGEIEKEEEFWQALNKRITSLDGIKQQMYINELIKAKFRLKCAKIHTLTNNKNIIEDLRNSSQAERIIYSTILMEDITRFSDQLSEISTVYKVNGMRLKAEESIQYSIDTFDGKVSTKYAGSSKLERVFDDDDLMKDYLRILEQLSKEQRFLKGNIKEHRQQLEREEQERIRKQEKEEEEKKRKEEMKAKEEQKQREREERKERYKSLDEKQMKAEIERLDGEKVDMTQSYLDILDFEMEVGEAKGILKPKNEMKREDQQFFRVKKSDVFHVMKNAKELVQRCMFFVNVDDSKDENCIVACSRDANISELNKRKGYKKLGDHSGCYYMYDLCRISPAFANFLEENIVESDMFTYNVHGMLRYNDSAYYASGCLDVLKKNVDKIKKMTTPNDMTRDIPFYIEMSYLRPMIPILEELSANEIDFYIPPSDKKTKKYNAKKRIYIDRKYLPKYKELIHSKFSNASQGIIDIGLENIDYADFVLDGCEFPFEVKKEQR